MKYVKEYLKDAIKIKPLGELTTKDDELNGMSGEMVYIDGKCSDIFISHADYANWLEKQGGQKPAKNIVETWKDMRLEVYQQASGNRHEPNYSDDSTKCFSLNDIDEIIEKMSEQKPFDYENANIQQKDFAPKIEHHLDEKKYTPIDVDLERDAVNFCHDKGLNTTPYIAKTIALHFYELGLNTKKED